MKRTAGEGCGESCPRTPGGKGIQGAGLPAVSRRKASAVPASFRGARNEVELCAVVDPAANDSENHPI
jgi:hypothetical protein